MDYREKIKTRRKEIGMSQYGLARAIKKTQTFVSEIEGGRKKPSLGTLRDIYEVLGLESDLNTTSTDILVNDILPESIEIIELAKSRISELEAENNNWATIPNKINADSIKTYHLNSEETELIECFRQLNREGQQSLCNTAYGLTQVPIYKKYPNIQVGKISKGDKD